MQKKDTNSEFSKKYKSRARRQQLNLPMLNAKGQVPTQRKRVHGNSAPSLCLPYLQRATDNKRSSFALFPGSCLIGGAEGERCAAADPAFGAGRGAEPGTAAGVPVPSPVRHTPASLLAPRQVCTPSEAGGKRFQT